MPLAFTQEDFLVFQKFGILPKHNFQHLPHFSLQSLFKPNNTIAGLSIGSYFCDSSLRNKMNTRIKMYHQMVAFVLVARASPQ